MTAINAKPRAGEHMACRHGIYSNRVCEICAEADPIIAQLDALAAQNRELVDGIVAAQHRLNDAKLKGRGNDFYAAIVAVEQDLRGLLAKIR